MEYSLFGCKVNKFYLNKWLAYFKQRWFSDPKSHLMATCVVTDRAKTKRVKEAKKLLQEGAHLYLTWCGAFSKGEAMEYDPFFAIYPWLKKYKDQLTLLGEDPLLQSDVVQAGEYELNREIEQADVSWENIFTKKYIVIQSGCDTFCTFCLTIYKRGSHRSRTEEEIIDEIKQFVDQWGKEIVITGVNLAARGASHTRKPQESRFSQLLEAILTKTTIKRIRISSLGPEFLDDRFYELMEDERFLPHFHVSIQHFEDGVLRRMNRNYTTKTLDTVLKNLRWLQRPDKEFISIWADLIVGFPGEREQDFQLLLESIQAYQITKLHAFPFSPHQKGETVPAWKLSDAVPADVKRERMERILTIGDQVRAQFIAANTGKEREVLVEKKQKEWWEARTPNYIPVVVKGTYARWDLVRVTV